jgi:hypothetical protein
MATSKHRSRPERGASVVLVLVIVAAALAVVALLVVVTIAGLEQRRVVKSWEQELGSLEEILARYPPREANGAALALETLTAPLGIDLVPRWVQDRARPSDEEVEAHQSISLELSDYLNRHLERDRRAIDAPPPDLASFLEARADAIGSVRRHLAGGEVPEWERHVERMAAAPLPNLLGQMNLHRLLLTDALVRLQAGSREEALASLEASWRLNESLRDDPTLIGQLIAIAVARMQAGALRQVDGVPDEWLARIEGRDHRAPFFAALALEGWMWSQPGWSLGYEEQATPWERLVMRVTRPYYRYCLADASDAMRERVANLSRLDALCGVDLAAHDADLAIPLPWWNWLGGELVQNVADALDRLIRMELDLELTRKLLELESAEPRPVPASDPSQACPGDRWIYESASDGSVTITFGREMTWPGMAGAVLSNHFTLEPSMR